MSAIVRDILDRIAQLSEQDRLELERELARAADAEWERETAIASQVAKERGIDDATIQRVIDERRYSQKRRP